MRTRYKLHQGCRVLKWQILCFSMDKCSWRMSILLPVRAELTLSSATLSISGIGSRHTRSYPNTSSAESFEGRIRSLESVLLWEPIPDHSPPSRDLSKSSHSVHSIVYWNGSLQDFLWSSSQSSLPMVSVSTRLSPVCHRYVGIVPAQDLSCSSVTVWNSRLSSSTRHRSLDTEGVQNGAEQQSSRQSENAERQGKEIISDAESEASDIITKARLSATGR